jgi:tetratricopeptide (TPR) repeat protein
LYLGDLYSLGYGKGYSGALSIYQKVLVLAPQNKRACVEAYTGIGMLHHVPGTLVNRQDTLIAFQSAVEIAPSCASTHHNLGMALYERGEYRAALEKFNVTKKLLQNAGESIDHIHKIIMRIENNLPFHSGGYTRCSVVEDWPLGKLD